MPTEAGTCTHGCEGLALFFVIIKAITWMKNICSGTVTRQQMYPHATKNFSQIKNHFRKEQARLSNFVVAPGNSNNYEALTKWLTLYRRYLKGIYINLTQIAMLFISKGPHDR